MSIIHFLNVKEGDCSVIQHDSNRVSVIDVCNAKPTETEESKLEKAYFSAALRGVLGNFNQKAHPVNPIEYFSEHEIDSIWRFILTHPDMDHMDGLQAFLGAFPPVVFWDTNNKKEMESESWSNSPYNQDDWELYKSLRDSNPQQNPKRLTNFSGDNGQYWNRDENGNVGGDGYTILAPTPELVDEANRTGDYNDCSYVLLLRTNGSKVIFGGDSHDKTWDYILERWESDIRDIDVLIAPHHGRDSGRSYDFLNVLNPALTFFGNARSEHLAYYHWRNRGLPIVTNNQANCMIVDANVCPMKLYVTNKTYAERVNPNTFFNKDLLGWYVGDITR